MLQLIMLNNIKMELYLFEIPLNFNKTELKLYLNYRPIQSHVFI